MRKIRQGREARRSFDRWLDLQKELQARLEFSLRERLGPEPPALSRYRQRYYRLLPRWTGRRLDPAELTARLVAADLVLLGDYHSLAQSQRSALRLLKRMQRAGRAPALALEMVPVARQRELDAYQSGALSEAGFLALFRKGWDFPWKPVRTLLSFARYHGLPVIALNSNPRGDDNPLNARDREAARAIQRFRRRHRGRPVFAIMGDFHLAETGLPAALRQEGFDGRLLRCFQNPEPLYWQSLETLGECPEILELEGGEVAVQSATPIVKLQSYHYWITGQELDQDTVTEAPPGDPADLLPDLSEEVDGLLHQVARFLRLPLLEEAPAAVIWTGQEDFPQLVESLEGWTLEEVNLVATSLAWGQGCYLHERNLAFLAKLSQNRVAEMAGRILHARSARILSRPRSLVDDFYLRVLETALVFLASRVINPMRKYRDQDSLRAMLERNRAGRNGWRGRARRQLRYLEAEEGFLRKGDESALDGRFFRLPPHEHQDLTRAVGKHLGGRLHEALMAGALDRHWLRGLFFDRLPLEGAPTRRYFEILDRLWDGEGWVGSKRQMERL